MRLSAGRAASAVLLCIGIISCRTTAFPSFESAPLVGVIFDETHLPVAGARIEVEGHSPAESDVNGRFVVDSVARGPIRCTAKKPGYATIDAEFDFSRQTQILYLTFQSYAEFRSRIEEQLELDRAAEAADLARALLDLGADGPIDHYVAAFAFFRAGEPDQAVKQIDWLRDNGFDLPEVDKLAVLVSPHRR